MKSEAGNESGNSEQSEQDHETSTAIVYHTRLPETCSLVFRTVVILGDRDQDIIF